MFNEKTLRRGIGLVAVCFTFAACDTVDRLLEAENPGAIGEEQLSDPALIEVLVNSVTGELGSMYDDPFIWRGSMFTDEQITGINWEQTARLNLRVIRFDEGDADGMFSNMSSFRFMADSVSGRLEQLLDDPASDERLAQVYALAGYAYTLMAEALCEATINVGSEIYSPAQLADFGIARFQKAVQIGNAASADDIVDLAEVGLARAALLAGDNQLVMSSASQVSPGFTWWVEYADQINDNVLQARVSGSNHSLGVHPRFLNGTFGDQDIIDTQTDPRVQHTVRWTTGHNALTKLYKPYQSLPYSEFDASAVIANGKTPKLFDDDTDIKLASYIEAMHHYYEAAGPSGSGPEGTTLDFVNSRRAFGNQAPVNLSGDALMAELREQRGRDLYLGGFRLGDLRRWKANGVGDFFPTGDHVTDGPAWGQYGDATCFPLPSTEYEGNPNIRRGG